MSEQKKIECVITAPDLRTVEFEIEGTAGYVQHKFSDKAKEKIKKKQIEGSTGKKNKQKEGKDFDAVYEGVQHKTEDGQNGIPAPAFRAALIRACSLVGFKMTIGKMSVFVLADGTDASDGTPLVYFTKGKPRKVIHHVRLDTGVCDLACRAMWDPGWRAKVRIMYDASQFTLTDVANLLQRAGMQVGIGCGRPDSKTSSGCGWGTFKVVGQ